MQCHEISHALGAWLDSALRYGLASAGLAGFGLGLVSVSFFRCTVLWVVMSVLAVQWWC